MPYTEANYENAVVRLFVDELDYTHLYGPDVERDYHSPLYEDGLWSALARLNPRLPQAAIQEAVDKLRTFDTGTLLQKNITFTDYLQNGVPVKFWEGGEERSALVYLVDDLGIPVICYGLRADFKGDLFPGSEALLVMADKLEEVKTVCWCGRKATFNARFDHSGKILKEGAQVELGANDKYIGLCRRHWMAGDLGPDFHVEDL